MRNFRFLYFVFLFLLLQDSLLAIDPSISVTETAEFKTANTALKSVISFLKGYPLSIASLGIVGVGAVRDKGNGLGLLAGLGTGLTLYFLPGFMNL